MMLVCSGFSGHQILRQKAPWSLSMSAFRERITAQFIVFGCFLQYHFPSYTIQRFCGSLMQNSKRNSLVANGGKTSANEEIRRCRKREFNRGTNRARMFLPVPLFAPGFAPLADVHADGQFLCKRQPSTVKPVYAKYYDERNFWSFTRAFSIFPAVSLFASSRKRGFFPTALFCRDVAWMREHDVINKRGQARPATPASNVMRVTKEIKGA